MNYPNKILKEDFDSWVQERGLYFPNGWSKEYETIFSWNDNGEKPKKGSLLMFPPLWPWVHQGMKPINKPKYMIGSYLHFT